VPAFITDHARRRLKERVGLPKRAMQRMADRALQEGQCHRDARGRARRYLDRLYLKEETANQIRVHGAFVYLFEDRRLITVLPALKWLSKGMRRD